MSHVLAIDWLDRLLTLVAPLGLTTTTFTALYYVAFSYGLGVVALAIGKDSTVKVVTGLPSGPLITMVGLPLIPVGLILLEITDVEGRVLSYWRSIVSPVLSTLPLFGNLLNWLWPTPTRVPRDTSQSDLGGTVDYVARSMTVGLLLPFAAYYTGKFCFKSMENGFKRMLLGGLLIYGLKTLVFMYLRQQQFRRQGFRRVVDYNPKLDPQFHRPKLPADTPSH